MDEATLLLSPQIIHRSSDIQKSQSNGAFKAFRKVLSTPTQTIVDSLRDNALVSNRELCLVCGKFDWQIPEAVEYGELQSSLNVVVRLYGHDETSSTSSWLQPVWTASELPKGSLFELMNHSDCPVCRLVLHLFSPLSTKAFLEWAQLQPMTVLKEHQYSLQFREDRKVHVSVSLPRGGGFRDAGFIEVGTGGREGHRIYNLEQATVWGSCKLSFGLVQTSKVNYSLVRDWLKHCDTKHTRCLRNRAEKTHDTPIRLVDVIGQKIIRSTTGTSYFALSYVWGGVSVLRATTSNILELERPNSLRRHANVISRTVQDAMEFVRHVGGQYLWVDSLCIVQDDANDKHDQISQMHEIYSAAYVTIVSHTGIDANAGLPGVRPGTRSMLATKSYPRGKVAMATSNYKVPDILRGSVHSGRGWTLQEVLVSHRCLHFFDKQLTFVCTEEFVQDWRSVDLNAASREMTRFKLPKHVLWQMNPLAETRELEVGGQSILKADQAQWLRYFEIYARIMSDYTSRSLSYESDILLAFRGISSAIARLTIGRFFYGLPSVSFDHALLWVPASPAQRRKFPDTTKIPSWSWAGWAGQFTYNCCKIHGGPSTWFHLNSYIKEFYVVENGVSRLVERQDMAILKRNRQSAYYEARKSVQEPPVDLHKTAWCPQGCLHFWAEEASMHQFRVKVLPANNSTTAQDGRPRLFPFLYLASSDRRCGILAPSSDIPTRLTSPLPTIQISDGGRSNSWGTTEMRKDIDTSEYSLVLMSESEEPLLNWKAPRDIGLTRLRDPPVLQYSDEFRYGVSFYFNVLLVRRIGLFVERLAYGQVHPDVWLDARRVRRYVRML